MFKQRYNEAFLNETTLFFKEQISHYPCKILITEAATEGVLQKKMFLKILQNSLENACAKVFFIINMEYIFLCNKVAAC